MVCDYERAWLKLQQTVASKTQHGREGLLTEMAAIAEDCQVSSGELPRLLRLYGVEVERARAIATETRSSDDERFQADGVRAGIAASEHIIDRGGHDGSSNAGSGNGRRRV